MTNRESTSPVKRERIGARPRVTRDRHQRFSHRQKRCGGRGTGAVMATGSYEGPLPMEGILDRHEASSVTRGRSGWSWRVLASSDLSETFQKTDGQSISSTCEGA